MKDQKQLSRYLVKILLFQPSATATTLTATFGQIKSISHYTQEIASLNFSGTNPGEPSSRPLAVLHLINQL